MFKTISSLLIISGIIISILIFLPVIPQEIRYQINKSSLKSDKQFKDEKDLSIIPAMVTPASLDFSLMIPKIGVNSPVFANIDSSNEQEYKEVLKKGVAHAKGSSLPNQHGVVFLFAHSTDSWLNFTSYNAVFYLINKLEKNDQIFVFYNQQKYIYSVTDKKIVSAAEVTKLAKSITADALILQTCYPPGTTLKRLVVIAQRSS